MNYFKLAGAGLILVCCTLTGFYFSYRLKIRLRCLGNIIDLMSRLGTNMRYFGGDVFELVKISSPSFLIGFFDNDISPFGAYWERAVGGMAKTCFLKRDEADSLVEFGRLLGTTDVEGQLCHIGIYKGVFSAARDNLREEYKTKARLYKSLGFFAGATLALSLI